MVITVSVGDLQPDAAVAAKTKSRMHAQCGSELENKRFMHAGYTRAFTGRAIRTACTMQQFDYDILDSTNDEARRLLAAGRIKDRAVIRARGQTAGRGTRGRSWASPSGAGLYFSYVCRNRSDSEVRTELPLTTAYTQAAGVACVEAARDVVGVNLRIKPINDLIWNGCKVGGILTEASVEDTRITALIVGVGLNIYPADRSLPADSLPAATLADAVAPAVLDHAILPNLERAIVDRLEETITTGRLGSIESDWRRLLIESTGGLLPE